MYKDMKDNPGELNTEKLQAAMLQQAGRKSVKPGELDPLILQLIRLNRALLAGRSVFAVCETKPQSRDRGRHCYNVYFVNEDGRSERLAPWSDLGRKCLGIGKRESVDRGYFSSGAHGMSRLMDATDIIFYLLKAAGGVYAQIDEL